MRHLKGADGIRGLACLIVVSLHSIGFFFNNIQYYTLGMDKLGVWIFFVLSSFLLTRQFITNGFSAGSIIDYIVSRILRIIPAYIICVLVYAKLGLIEHENIINAVTFQYFYFHLWTIPVEFKYYFILPFVAFTFVLITERFGVAFLMTSCFIIACVFQYLFPIRLGFTSITAVYPYIPCFLYGSVAAILLDKLKNHTRFLDLTGFAILAVFVMISPGFISFMTGVYLGPYIVDKYNYVGILIAIFIYMYATGSGYIGKVLTSKALTYVGKYSFSIYLYHVIFLKFISDKHQHSLTWLLFAMAISVGAGGIMFYLIEKPLLRARKVISVRFKLATI